MISLFISFLIFAVCYILHVIIGRNHIKYGINVKWKTIWIFGAGLLLYLYFSLFFDIKNSLIYTGAFIYIIASILHWIYFTSPYLGDRSPSSEILLHVSYAKKMNYAEILSMFTNERLIGKRINDLIVGGYIIKKGETYSSTVKGKKLIQLITMYRNLIKWDLGG